MSWALSKNDSHYTVAKKAGLDPKLNLASACADFYWLERQEADGMPGAAEKMSEVETYIAQQMAIYLDMACGGELRLLPIQHHNEDNDYECNGRWCGSGGESCYGCDGYFDSNGCGMCHDLTCTVNKKPWDMSTFFEATVKLFKCIADTGRHPQPYECDCRSHEQGDPSWRWDIKPELIEFFDSLDYDGSPVHRYNGWQAWLDFRKDYGIIAIKWMAEALDNGHWNGSCGGEKWAAAATLLYEYLNGDVSARVMVNMAWSMEHNGGCIFNKVYAVDTVYEDNPNDSWNAIMVAPSLMKVLEEQAEDNYGYLEKYLSEPIRKFKDYARLIGKTAIGRKYAAESKRDKLEPFLYYRELSAIAPFGE